MSVSRIVKVIVNGVATDVRIDRRRNIRTLVLAALRQTRGILAVIDIDTWELRDADGKLLEQPVACRDYGITGGETMYLQPKAGVGA